MKKLDKEGMLRKYETTFAELSQEKPLSPIIGMGMVSLRQVEEYCGVDHDTFQKARQKAKADLDALGAHTETARYIGSCVVGARKTEQYGYILPLEDGGNTEIPCGRYSYFTAAAVKRLAEEIRSKGKIEDKKNGQVRHGVVAVFEHTHFGKVRTVQIDGEPWLVGKDVATILGYKDTDQAIRTHVDNEDKLTRGFNGGAQTRAVTVINESGLYSLVLFSKLPSAKKFRHWVTNEVLPSIRKNGGYIAGQETLSDVELLAKAVLVAQKAIEERNAHIADLESEAERNRSKVAFAEAVEQSNKSITVGAFAKILYDRDGISMGRNTMFRWLRDRKLLDANNYPYQRYMNAGYFEVAEIIRNGRPCRVPFITGKGQAYLVKKLMGDAYVAQ